MRFFSLLVLALLIVGCQDRQAALSAELVGPDPINTAFASPAYGIHTSLWWEVGDGEINDIRLVEEMGFSWVKQAFTWRDIETIEKGKFDWWRPDRIVEEAEKASLNLLVRLDRQPFWAQADPSQPLENSPPANYDDYGDFCFAVADRYRGRIAAYQVWNEPNLDREWGGRPPSPAEYTELLKTCSLRIREADPNALVLSAGLAPTGTHNEQVIPDELFLRGMYEAGANEYFDVLGLHASGFAYAPDRDPDEIAELHDGHRFFSFRHVEDMRRIMLEYGDGSTQVALLEMGWTTDTRPDSSYTWHAVDEQTQADYLVQAYAYAAEHWQPWMGLMTTLYIADISWTPDNEQWWWSIVLPDDSKRPAYDALSAMEKSS